MQLSSLIFYILIGVIVLLFALFWIIGYDMPYDDNPDYSAPLLTDALIWFMIVLTFSTFGLAVFGAINGMRKNKGENVVVNNVPARRILWRSSSVRRCCLCLPTLSRVPMRSW